MSDVGSARGQVLVLEDEEDLGPILLEILRDAGYEPHLAKTVSEAEGFRGRIAPAVVVSDLTLPDAPVPEVIARLRKAWPGIPLLLTSAKPAVELRRIASEHGADGALPKPFDVEQLQEAVGRLTVTR
jgi:DNA-binding response OmpR family regulator